MIESFINTSHNFANGGIASLGIDPKLLILQILTFAIIFYILKRKAFGPIIQALESRYEKIESSIENAEKLEEANAEAVKETDKLLTKARSEADNIIGKSHKEAGAIVEAAEQKAAQAADRFLEQAHKTLDGDVQKARQQIKTEMVGLVSDATEAIIGEKVSSSKDKQLIESTLSKAGVSK